MTGQQAQFRRRGGIGGIALSAACALMAVPAIAAPTPAGTRIENVAALTFGTDVDRRTIASNAVVLNVDEVIDVAVAADRETVAVPAAGTVLAVGFVVDNRGNGTGAFALAANADRDAVVAGLTVDADDDGVYDPARDPALTGAEVTLATGERRRLFVLVRGALQAGTAVSLAATAIRGHGAPGTVVSGAVIGPGGASASARTLLTDAAATAPRLDKFQSVVAPDGSARPMPGAVVTYRLEARFAGPTAGVIVSDAVPAGTTFVAGSITLDDRLLTDAAGFDGTTVRVVIGDVPAAGLRTIRFQTRIQ